MQLYFLGTCAGTEPMPERKHTAFTLESNGKIYWFDAGEGCSYTAHNLGLDLTKVEKIVISHPHVDHTSGLVNLIWNIRKLHWLKKTAPAGDLDIYLPEMTVWNGVMTILKASEGTPAFFDILQPRDIRDGLLFDDGTISVTAFHNNHIAPLEDKWRSYSFLIETEGKRIVYSGDVKAYQELDPVIADGCDALIIETGHFVIDDVYAYTKGKNIGKIFFNHSGREILYATAACEEKVASLFGKQAVIAFDGMTANI